MRRSARTRKRERKRVSPAPARLPGLNFDTFEQEVAHDEGAYGTDRAPTYQARYAAESPRRYVRRLLNWVRGRPKRATVRRARRTKPIARKKTRAAKPRSSARSARRKAH